jgi:hypothetical protein
VEDTLLSVGAVETVVGIKTTQHSFSVSPSSPHILSLKINTLFAITLNLVLDLLMVRAATTIS